VADLGTAGNVTGALGAAENATAGNRPSLAVNYAY
jgi:hypothetical protein